MRSHNICVCMYLRLANMSRTKEAQKKRKKACLHLPRQGAEQIFGAAASRIMVEYADLLLISARAAAVYGRRKEVAVVLLAVPAFRLFPQAEIFSFCRRRFSPFVAVCRVLVLAAVVAITAVREQALLDLRRKCFPKVFDKQQFQLLPRGMGRKHL